MATYRDETLREDVGIAVKQVAAVLAALRAAGRQDEAVAEWLGNAQAHLVKAAESVGAV